MPEAFCMENLSIHFKILIGLKDQFDLHNLLYFFMKIRPVHCVNISIDILW